jgi:hypothetical protein
MSRLLRACDRGVEVFALRRSHWSGERTHASM